MDTEFLDASEKGYFYNGMIYTLFQVLNVHDYLSSLRNFSLKGTDSGIHIQVLMYKMTESTITKLDKLLN